MLQWTLSPDALFVLVATVALAGMACVFSSSRALGPFVLVALALAALATPFMAAGAPTLRGGIAAALWVVYVVGCAALVLGLLVARATSARRILLAAGVLLVLQVPAAFVAQAYLDCYVGHYCPGIA